jgi:hypothetical protein
MLANQLQVGVPVIYLTVKPALVVDLPDGVRVVFTHEITRHCPAGELCTGVPTN